MAILGGIGAAVGGASSLYSLFGGGNNVSSIPAPPPVYQPQNLPGADQGATTGTQNLTNYNTAGQTLPYAQNTFQSLYNNPYAPVAQTGANSLAPIAYTAGTNLVGAGQSYLPYAQQALQTGFDPQNALYSQLFQQNTDQTRAGEAARGIAMSPYGAGVENQSNLNFNNQWLNQLLGRQQTAAGTANTLTGAAGTATNTGLNTATTGFNLPYATAQIIGGNQNNAIQSYGGFGQSASTLPQQQIQDYLQYLGLGNQSASAANAQYATALTAQNQNFNQMQTLGKNLGSSISGLGTSLGGSGGNGNFTTFQAPGYSFPQAA